MVMGKLFFTAHGVDVKLVNRLLLYIRDWRNGDEGSWDHFHIIRSRDDPVITSRSFEPDQVPLQQVPVSEWEGVPLAEIERWMIAKHDGRDTTTLFLLLDDQGVQDKTIICAQRTINWESPDDLYGDTFEKVRVPWEDVYLMWVNLDIANMNFEEFCHWKEGHDGNHWWRFRLKVKTPEALIKQRDEAIEELEKRDLA